MYMDFERHRAKFERTMLEFVDTELKLALTFCRVGKATNDPMRRSRNFHNAKAAYRSALDALNRLKETDAATMFQALLKDVERQLSSVR